MVEEYQKIGQNKEWYSKGEDVAKHYGSVWLRGKLCDTIQLGEINEIEEVIPLNFYNLQNKCKIIWFNF